MPAVWELVLTVLAGVGAGILSAMFGVGGAVVTTPAIRVLGATPLEAVGSTIPSIIPSAAVGAWRYQREGLVRWDVVWRTIPVGVVVAVLGGPLSHAIPGRGHIQMIATAALMAFTAYRMAVGARRPAVTAVALEAVQPEAAPVLEAPVELVEPAGDARTSWTLYGSIGAVAGALSGILGVGGGVILVPAFTELGRLPFKVATATSLVCVGMFGAVSMVSHTFAGDINWWYALALTVGVIPGARLGTTIALRVTSYSLQVGFAWLLGVLAVLYGATETVLLTR
ncbi:MAG: sulfite exporter TauE/SafE family protein [Acidimicrobiia bacterium]